MNVVAQPSLLVILILVGLVGLVLLMILVCINSSLFRRLSGRSLETQKKAKKPVATQGWSEAGRRTPTPTASEIESQFGESGEDPPKKERP